jgi:hypothetical protein
MIGTDFNTATTSLASTCIGWAESEVDKYLSKRYDLSSSPFNTSTSIPPVVTTISEWLAQGYMYQQLGRGGKEAMDRGQKFIDRGVENLMLVANYKLDILDLTGDVVSESSTGAFRVQCSTTDYPTTFDEDNELNWAVSTEKLDDISSNRD